MYYFNLIFPIHLYMIISKFRILVYIGLGSIRKGVDKECLIQLLLYVNSIVFALVANGEKKM